MLRTLLVLLAASAALAAPAPKAPKAEPYFPTAKGATKVFQTTLGDEVAEVTETVTAVDQKDGTVRVTVSRNVNTDPAGQSVTEVSEKGLSLLSTDGDTYPVPAPLLRLSARAGETWTWEREKPGGGTAVRTTYTARGEEDVEVPAGKFRAIRIDSQLEIKSRVLTSSHWYAPGVGLVKMVSTSGGVDRTQALKSFTPGK
jgi:hypothetical protein